MMEKLTPERNFMTPIAHFEDRYLIGEDGVIVSRLSNQPLKPTMNPNGYLKVALATGNSSEQHLVHILVARHFIPNPYNHPVVNHKDGIKTNCIKSNLEWTTHQGNTLHALQNGLVPGYMSFDDKEAYMRRVLAGEQVNDIAFETGRRVETLHRMFRETAKKLNLHDQWAQVMKENRKNAAIRNLEKINSKRP